MGRTFVEFHARATEHRSQAEAYVWTLNQYLIEKGDFFKLMGAKLGHICVGARGAIYFSPSPAGMRRAAPLRNGWWAETGLSEKQKADALYLLAQAIGVSSERDYRWKADNRPTRKYVDVETLKKSLLARNSSGGQQ